MKLDKITNFVPVKTQKQLSEVLPKSLHHSILPKSSRPEMSAARINVELRAEAMDPEDYIRMRTYLADLETYKFMLGTMNV